MSQPTIILVGPDAATPVNAVARNEPFTIQVTLPDGDATPPSIDVTVRGDSDDDTVRLVRVGDSTTYRSGTLQFEPDLPYRLDSPYLLNADSTDGEAFTVSVDGAAADVRVYDSRYTKAIDQTNQFLNLKRAYWLTIVQQLRALDDRGDEETRWLDAGETVIRMIDRARSRLWDESLFPRVRAAVGAFYVGQLRAPLTPQRLEQLARWETTRGATAGWSRDEESGFVARILREEKDAVFDVLWRQWGVILLYFYQQVTEATLASQFHELLLGKDIYGRQVDSRLGAVLDLALEGLGELGGQLFGKWLRTGGQRRDYLEELVSAERKRERGGAPFDPVVATRGMTIPPEDAGILSEAMREFQRVADRDGVQIVIRPANPDSLRWQRLGHPRKPMKIKQKTIQKLDTYIGANEDDIGLVGFFAPHPPRRPAGMSDADWKKLLPEVEARHRKRSEEWGDPDLQAHTNELVEKGLIRLEDGKIIDTGLSTGTPGQGTGLAITGDYDLYAIYRGGRLLSEAEAEPILAVLKLGVAKVQHGAHVNWVYTAAGHYRTKLEIMLDHTAPGSKQEAWLVERVRAANAFLGNPNRPIMSKGEALVVVTPGDGRLRAYQDGLMLLQAMRSGALPPTLATLAKRFISMTTIRMLKRMAEEPGEREERPASAREAAAIEEASLRHMEHQEQQAAELDRLRDEEYDWRAELDAEFGEAPGAAPEAAGETTADGSLSVYDWAKQQTVVPDEDLDAEAADALAAVDEYLADEDDDEGAAAGEARLLDLVRERLTLVSAVGAVAILGLGLGFVLLGGDTADQVAEVTTEAAVGQPAGAASERAAVQQPSAAPATASAGGGAAADPGVLRAVVAPVRVEPLRATAGDVVTEYVLNVKENGRPITYTWNSVPCGTATADGNRFEWDHRDIGVAITGLPGGTATFDADAEEGCPHNPYRGHEDVVIVVVAESTDPTLTGARTPDGYLVTRGFRATCRYVGGLNGEGPACATVRFVREGNVPPPATEPPVAFAKPTPNTDPLDLAIAETFAGGAPADVILQFAAGSCDPPEFQLPATLIGDPSQGTLTMFQGEHAPTGNYPTGDSGHVSTLEQPPPQGETYEVEWFLDGEVLRFRGTYTYEDGCTWEVTGTPR